MEMGWREGEAGVVVSGGEVDGIVIVIVIVLLQVRKGERMRMRLSRVDKVLIVGERALTGMRSQRRSEGYVLSVPIPKPLRPAPSLKSGRHPVSTSCRSVHHYLPRCAYLTTLGLVLH